LYIQDTKSSGGTFVNGDRLSESGEESGLKELRLEDNILLGEDADADDGFCF
jgi:pSer/pThr/pTyr-binding forkhead associated (FHA) protein